MQIFKLHHTPFAPVIRALPDHDHVIHKLLSSISKQPKDTTLPEFYLADPGANSKNFFHLTDSVLVFNRKTWLGQMGGVLNLAGNVHEIRLRDTREELFLLNITARYNCIDREHTFYHAPDAQTEKGVDHQMGVKQPAFFTNLIGDSSIFRIPQKGDFTIYVKSDGHQSSDDFYYLCQKAKIQAFSFEEVWSD